MKEKNKDNKNLNNFIWYIFLLIVMLYIFHNWKINSNYNNNIIMKIGTYIFSIGGVILNQLIILFTIILFIIMAIILILQK